MMNIHSIQDRRPLHLACVAVLFSIGSYALLLGKQEIVIIFAEHEAIYEHLSALFFLITSFAYFASFYRMRHQKTGSGTWQKTLYLLLGFFFFVALGEETGWGQGYFGYSPPPALKSLNVQEQVTIHNLWLFDSYTLEGKRKSGVAALLTANRLFDYFMIMVFVLIPFGRGISSSITRMLQKIGIPRISGWFAAPLLSNLSLTVIFELLFVDSSFLHLAVSETRELNYSVLCLVLACYLFANVRQD